MRQQGTREREEKRRTSPPKFSDARAFCGASFDREKKRVVAVIIAIVIVVVVVEGNSGIKYWFLTRHESSSFHGSFPRSRVASGSALNITVGSRARVHFTFAAIADDRRHQIDFGIRPGEKRRCLCSTSVLPRAILRSRRIAGVSTFDRRKVRRIEKEENQKSYITAICIRYNAGSPRSYNLKDRALLRNVVLRRPWSPRPRFSLRGYAK